MEKKKQRTTITLSPDLLEWWKNNSIIPLSSFIELKLKEFSSSFKPELPKEPIKEKTSFERIKWMK